jgi:hypothetical protein
MRIGAVVAVVVTVGATMVGAAFSDSSKPRVNAVSSMPKPQPMEVKRIPGTNDPMPVASLANDPEAIEQGKYLVEIVGCNDCHTPFKMTERGPEPDMSRMLSGHPQGVTLPEIQLDPRSGWAFAGASTNTAFAGPWGVSYAANLTPDVLTGMGIWTEDNFVNAIRNGKHWGTARPIMPPMPWQAFSKMTDYDLKAIYAYLRTIPAINNQVPDWEAPKASKQEKPR